MDGYGRIDCNGHNWHNALVQLSMLGIYTERLWMRDFDYSEQMVIGFHFTWRTSFSQSS